MSESSKQSCGCSSNSQDSACCSPGLEMLPMYQPPTQENEDDVPCCGPPAGPPSSPDELPGYQLCSFVARFISTPVGTIPQVKTTMDKKDWQGTFFMRMGFGRNDYKVTPGIYAVGSPNDQSPVLVTANYKLSFDHVRRSLTGMNLWILVLDTRGINVWCAAGKGTFGTQELIQRVHQTGLAKLVQHRQLILPQLGATGVSARKVKQGCGFEVIWGPVQAADIKAFLDNGRNKSEAMSRVTFNLIERLVLVPVEITLLKKHLLWTIAAIVLLSGIGPNFFSISAVWQRGIWALLATITGIVAGCAVAPALLPWLPGREFALKGVLSGAVLGTMIMMGFGGDTPHLTGWSMLALVLLTTALSSYLAMSFTGSTPFTSPSGVEKEMRRFIPMQLSAVLVAVVLWVVAAF